MCGVGCGGGRWFQPVPAVVSVSCYVWVGSQVNANELLADITSKPPPRWWKVILADPNQMCGDLHQSDPVFPPFLSPLLLSFALSSLPLTSLKTYVTVGHLNQIYAMPKVEISPTSPLHQPLQAGAVDPTFFYLPSPRGSSLSLSAEVCGVFLPVFPSF